MSKKELTKPFDKFLADPRVKEIREARQALVMPITPYDVTKDLAQREMWDKLGDDLDKILEEYIPNDKKK